MTTVQRRSRIAIALLSSVGISGGCAVVDTTILSTQVAVGQAMTSRQQDITGQDVYQGQALWESYHRDAVYEVKRDLFYGRKYLNGLGLDDLIKPGDSLTTIPKSIESYLADPARWPAIKGVVPAGTKLRVSRVLYMADLNMHDFYYVGVFDDGPISGREVLLNQLSLARTGLGKPHDYDPRFLAPLNAP